MRGEWKTIAGEPDTWEAALFPDLTTAQPCDLGVLIAIARVLYLPWPNLTPTRTEVIR